MLNNIRTARDTVRNPSLSLQLSLIDFLLVSTASMIHTVSDHVLDLKKELAIVEDGKLRIHIRKEGTHFGYVLQSSDSETNITDDMDLVYALARKEFLERSIHLMQNDVKRLQLALDRSKDARERIVFHNRMSRFNDAGLDLTRILFSKEQNEWIDASYSPNPFYAQNLKYPTKGNLMMRSNSEVKLGNMSEAFGLPYRYDDLVTILPDGHGSMPYRETYFSDIKIPNLLGGITIHEHFGAFHIETYSTDSLKRLSDYRSFPIEEIPGRRVKDSEITWSFESDIANSDKLKQVFRRMLLPVY